MSEEQYHSASHCKYLIQYHIIWCPEFRFSVLKGDVEDRLKQILQNICDDYNYHGNSPFCMDDFKERKVPFMIIDTTGEEIYYSKALLNNKNTFVFMGDDVDKIQWDKLNGTIIG